MMFPFPLLLLFCFERGRRRAQGKTYYPSPQGGMLDEA